MKLIIAALIILLISFQYRLWIGEGSLAHRTQLQRQIDQQETENQLLQERNHVIALEVEELKSGYESIEERAREQMGMIKQGETFFMVVEPSAMALEPSATVMEPSATVIKPSATVLEPSTKHQ